MYNDILHNYDFYLTIALALALAVTATLAGKATNLTSAPVLGSIYGRTNGAYGLLAIGGGTCLILLTVNFVPTFLGASNVHLELHPSPLVILPSSHSSPCLVMPSLQ